MTHRQKNQRSPAVPSTREALERLISAKVQESLHLEYKDSRALGEHGLNEVSKDVSSFANADGGTLIYGISEKAHIPDRIDDGVALREMTRERLEQIIESRVAPKLECVIKQIPVDQGRAVFVVRIAKSYRGPHQDRVMKKYYKRRNFAAEPMEDYEIADLRARTQVVPSLIRFDAQIRSTNLFFLVVENIGTAAANDVSFAFDRPIQWKHPDEEPHIFAKGVKHFPPRARYDVFYGVGHEVLGVGSHKPAEFVVSIKYRHAAIGKIIREEHGLDLRNYLGTWPLESPEVRQGKRVEEVLKSIASAVGKIEGSMKHLANMVGPTGLDVSVRSMRNLRHVVQGDGSCEKIDPMRVEIDVFQEVLGVDYQLAWHLRNHFRQTRDLKGMEQLEGITQEVIEGVKQHFLVTAESE